MCKELAPVMMAVLIAGRIGSAMAAEIGSMRVYQEIDALRTMNINPIHYLVLPRLIAISVALPLLVIFSDPGRLDRRRAGLAGQPEDRHFLPGVLQQPPRRSVDVGDVLNGLIKSFVFAVVIGTVSCHQGLSNHRRSARHRPFRHQGGGQLHRPDFDPRLLPDPLAALFRLNARQPSRTSHGVGVQVRGLRKSFNGQAVLKGVDLDVTPAKSSSSWARAAAARSVLLKQSSAWRNPTKAKSSSMAQSIAFARRLMEQYRMAMVFQSGALLNSLTVGENVGLYLTEHRLKPEERSRGSLREKLELVGLKGLESRMPERTLRRHEKARRHCPRPGHRTRS